MKTFEEINNEIKKNYEGIERENNRVVMPFLQIVKNERAAVFNPIADCFSTEAQIGDWYTKERYIGTSFTASVLSICDFYEKQDIRENNRIVKIVSVDAIKKGISNGDIKRDENDTVYDGYKFNYKKVKWVIVALYEREGIFSQNMIIPLRGLALLRGVDGKIVDNFLDDFRIKYLSQIRFQFLTEKIHIKRYNIDTYIPHPVVEGLFWEDEDNKEIMEKIQNKVIEVNSQYEKGAFCSSTL